MAPKSKQGNSKKGGNQQLSKEEKRLEAYLNHPANQANNNQASNNTNASSKKKSAGGQVAAADNAENQIAQLLKEVDLSKPLPDFTPLHNSIAILENTLESMDQLVADIKANDLTRLGKPPADEDDSLSKNQTLTPDILKKKDQIVKDVNRTIEILAAKQGRADALLKQENMSDMKEYLELLSANIGEDIKSKQRILAIF